MILREYVLLELFVRALFQKIKEGELSGIMLATLLSIISLKGPSTIDISQRTECTLNFDGRKRNGRLIFSDPFTFTRCS